MSRIDPSFAYAQARLQARFSDRPSAAEWSHVAATADLGALLQLLRSSGLAPWSARTGARPDVHEIERRVREEWVRSVDEVAAWLPRPWRESFRWLRWIVYLPGLQKLARGGRARAWMRDDPVLGPIVAREPRERGLALRRTPLAPLAGGFASPGGIAPAWTRHWRSLWPARRPGRAGLEALLRALAAQREHLAGVPASGRTDEALEALERRIRLIFRRNPLSPGAAAAYLALHALDLRRLRGELATRALREMAAAA
jgi:hypothetical protein